MKMMKKIATLLLAICLVVPCFSMVSQAANRIMFEDPSTAVGQTLALKGVIQTDSAMEDRTVVMTYDTNMLKFKSGDNVTETSAGKLTYDAKGAAGGQRVEFVMNFDVLKEGTTQVQVESYTVYSTTDASLTCEKGHSVITIAAGELPVTTEEPAEAVGAVVEVNGETYTFTNEFEEADIPEGFEESTLEYGGTEYKVVTQADTGLTLGYLVNESGEGKFFLYVATNATFAPFEQIEISDTTVITLLSDVEDIVLPEPYEKTQVEVNGIAFPAWQIIENKDVCVIYAMNNRGETSLYQYDIEEGTYQRFEAPVVEEELADTFMEKMDEMFGKYINTVIWAIGIGFILLLLVVIILSVKLYNRNAELDELYDEYGIDLFDEETPKKKDDSILNLDDEEDVLEDEEETQVESEEDEEETFEVIEEETVDDIVIAELDEVEASHEIEDPEDAIKAVAAEIEKDESFWNDDEDVDFEVDFIDLDD